MSKAMWGGRFSKSTDEMINEFQASINFDKRMYHEDIAGSIAHATMLAKCGIITDEDRDKIVAGLKDILQKIEEGNFEFTQNLKCCFAFHEEFAKSGDMHNVKWEEYNK